MVYEYPYWEEVLTEIDGLETLNFTLNDLTEENGLESGLETLTLNLIELVELESLNNNANNTNLKRKRFILLD
jgi:hypothetical protein